MPAHRTCEMAYLGRADRHVPPAPASYPGAPPVGKRSPLAATRVASSTAGMCPTATTMLHAIGARLDGAASARRRRQLPARGPVPTSAPVGLCRRTLVRYGPGTAHPRRRPPRRLLRAGTPAPHRGLVGGGARGARLPAGGHGRVGGAIRRRDAQRARLAAIAVPMHTALRVGVAVAARIRAVNPAGHICFIGLYASLNADHLLAGGGDSVIGGEGEAALVALAEALERGESGPGPGVGRRGRRAEPVKLSFPVPSRAQLPSIKRYAQLEHRGRGCSPATSRRAAGAFTAAATARSRRSTTGASSSCRARSSSRTSGSRWRRGRATSPSATPTS